MIFTKPGYRAETVEVRPGSMPACSAPTRIIVATHLKPWSADNEGRADQPG